MLTLEAKIRTVFGKQNKIIRDQDLIPAVVYGHQAKNQNLLINYLAFVKVFAEAGESSLVNLKVDEAKPIKALIQDVQVDPLTRKVIHIDFHQVREDEEITAETPINFIGESPAIKEFGGVLVKNLDAIKIECLPKDLLHQIDVDLTRLEKIGDCIYIRDLQIPGAVKVLENISDPVVSIIEPRSQKELEELTEKPAETPLPEGAEEKTETAEEPDNKDGGGAAKKD